MNTVSEERPLMKVKNDAFGFIFSSAAFLLFFSTCLVFSIERDRGWPLADVRIKGREETISLTNSYRE